MTTGDGVALDWVIHGLSAATGAGGTHGATMAATMAATGAGIPGDGIPGDGTTGAGITGPGAGVTPVTGVHIMAIPITDMDSTDILTTVTVTAGMPITAAGGGYTTMPWQIII